MSHTLAIQMQGLEDKLVTLRDGTEAIACVLANWDSVLQAISMASAKAAGIQKTLDEGPNTGLQDGMLTMPSTLVRIPADIKSKLRHNVYT
ncbi:hypothetical protein EYZ11_005928 [Aspergillus tanneri]|uniref:DASH complex subunit DAD2 n=1 Tax=Aspergillus tanneri TaxID=1220188 RepID=A0A4S3JHB9_9EURO|nr:hypothetical protein EYZ11_005928 [Aspergillus tanneri]